MRIGLFIWPDRRKIRLLRHRHWYDSTHSHHHHHSSQTKPTPPLSSFLTVSSSPKQHPIPITIPIPNPIPKPHPVAPPNEHTNTHNGVVEQRRRGLHVSLSRPFYLQLRSIEPFVVDLRRRLAFVQPFLLSFRSFGRSHHHDHDHHDGMDGIMVPNSSTRHKPCVLVNDLRTREYGVILVRPRPRAIMFPFWARETTSRWKWVGAMETFYYFGEGGLSLYIYIDGIETLVFEFMMVI